MTIEQNIYVRKPEWLKIKFPSNFSRIQRIKTIIRKNNLNTICEEASCPNLTKCFNQGVSTFIILGKICTRSCPFCNVTSGRPITLDINEPYRLAQAVADMALRYIVITSVNRDDLRDGGAQHFANCIISIRKKNPNVKIEILVPDFRGCMNRALEIFKNNPPDVFSHNIESVPRLYSQIRPGGNYKLSLKLLERFKKTNAAVPTKSGLILGMGETDDESIEAMCDMRQHGVNMLVISQYLQPSPNHLPVKRFISLDVFENMKNIAIKMGFTHVACGPLIRSSYQAELQLKNSLLT